MGLLLVLSSASCDDSDSASPDAMTTDAPMTDNPPYGGDMFVNDAFNDWGAPGKKVTFQYAGAGLYIARARMPAGLHLFKITDALWSAERTFSAATDHVVTIGLDEPTPLTAAPGGNHTNLAASKAAVYEFRLSVEQDPDAPTLVIVQDAPPYAAGMFLQGSFNDWGSEGNELPFIYFGDGRYAITVELAAGQHDLRLSDGTSEWTFSVSTEAEHGIAFDIERIAHR